MAAAPQATFPTLIFHAPDDTLTDPIGSREFLEASSSEDKRYVAAVGMWHDLIQEPGNEAILPQVCPGNSDLLCHSCLMQLAKEISFLQPPTAAVSLIP